MINLWKFPKASYSGQVCRLPESPKQPTLVATLGTIEVEKVVKVRVHVLEAYSRRGVLNIPGCQVGDAAHGTGRY